MLAARFDSVPSVAWCLFSCLDHIVLPSAASLRCSSHSLPCRPRSPLLPSPCPRQSASRARSPNDGEGGVPLHGDFLDVGGTPPSMKWSRSNRRRVEVRMSLLLVFQRGFDLQSCARFSVINRLLLMNRTRLSRGQLRLGVEF